MSANPAVVFRAQDSSSLYNSIKSRNSLVNAFDYSSEANICQYAKSKIEVAPQTAIQPSNAQVIKYQLPSHLIMNKLYLRTRFNGGQDTNAGGSNDLALSEFAGFFCVDEIRFIYQGSEIFRTGGAELFATEYARCPAEKAELLTYMSGGGALGETDGTIGNLTGRRAVASQAGDIDLTIPIAGFYSEKLSTGLDLSALSSPVHVEVSYKANSLVHEVFEADNKRATYKDSALICYGVELPSNERASFNARNYSLGSVSSQLGFSTALFQESATLVLNADNTNGALGTTIKLNSISGLVRRIFVWALLDSDISSKAYHKYKDISLVRLKDGNQVIYELENSSVGLDAITDSTASTNGYRTDYMMELYNNDMPMSVNKGKFAGNRLTALTLSEGTPNTLSAATITQDQGLYHDADGLSRIGSGECDLSKMKVINFGFDPLSRASADGMLSFNNLNSPTLEVKLARSATSASHQVNVCVEFVDIVAYSTAQNGTINIKQITE